VEARLDVQSGRCAGCGVVLQARAAQSAGYCPTEHVERSSLVGHRVICTRCHGLRHQNSAAREVRVGHSAESELSPQRFEKLLEACLRGYDARSPSGVSAPSSAGCGLVVYLLDLFDLEGSKLPGLSEKLLESTPVIVVGTKADTLPPGTSLERVEKWLRSACRTRILSDGAGGPTTTGSSSTTTAPRSGNARGGSSSPYATRDGSGPRGSTAGASSAGSDYRGRVASGNSNGVSGYHGRMPGGNSNDVEPVEVHLISSLTGTGVAQLADAVMRWAARRREHGDVYVIGAANVGKSSLINALIAPGAPGSARAKAQRRAREAKKRQVQLVDLDPGASRDAEDGDSAGAEGAHGSTEFELGGGGADATAEWDEKSNGGDGDGLGDGGDGTDDGDGLGDGSYGSSPEQLTPAQAEAARRAALPRLLTASHLPGTTLEPVRIRCRNGLSIFDTPGLVLPGQLAQLLTPQEVALTLPRAPVRATQLSLGAGKTLLLGGLARVDVLETGFSAHVVLAVHVAPAIALHPTSHARAEEVRRQHVGGLLTPPLGGTDRLKAIGPLVHTDVTIEGVGFRRAAVDVAIGGLGWLAVLGDGLVKLRLYAPKNVPVVAREPLVPMIDGTRGNAKFTGTRVVKAGKGKKGRR
jgi:ribosome biogenesis GTPase A